MRNGKIEETGILIQDEAPATSRRLSFLHREFATLPYSSRMCIGAPRRTTRSVPRATPLVALTVSTTT